MNDYEVKNETSTVAMPQGSFVIHTQVGAVSTTLVFPDTASGRELFVAFADKGEDE